MMTFDYMLIGLLLLLLFLMPWILVWYQLRELELARSSYNTMERLLLDALAIELNKTKTDDTEGIEDD